MKTIAIDVDDVLSLCGRSFIDYHNFHYGTNLTDTALQYKGDYWWYWNAVLKAEAGIDQQEAERRLMEFLRSDNHIIKQPVMNGAKEALLELKKNYKLVIITARHFSIEESTRQWLLDEFKDTFDDIYFIHQPDKKITKAEVCKSIGAEYLIDDAFDHCELAASQGITALMFGQYGWNSYQELPEKVIRIKNWKEILTFFEKTMDK